MVAVAHRLLWHLHGGRAPLMKLNERDLTTERHARFWNRTFWASLAVCEVLGLILIRHY